MRTLSIGFCLFVLCGLSGCSYGPASILDEPGPDPARLSDTIRAASDELVEENRRLQAMERQVRSPVEVEPLVPHYDPLEDHRISFAAVDESLKIVLYSLSQAVGMNLIMAPTLKTDDLLITINFENVSAAAVLREVLGAYDLYYEVKDNVIHVRELKEAMFRIDFLDTHIDADFAIGGDVLGASQEEGIDGLNGSFKVTGKGAEKGSANAYDVLDDMLRRIISQKGKYFINRLTGNLFVRDTPGNLEAIAGIVNQMQTTLSRQIRINARIIEVVLSNGHEYGVDWDVIRDAIDSKEKRLTEVAWSLETGLEVVGIYRNFNFAAAIDALNTFGHAKVISNPNIRAKHGQPAIISVGTSISYTESTQTTTTGGTNPTTEVDVDVSKLFDGLILGVIPYIESDRTVNLLINPIKSDVDRASLELVNIGNQQITLPQVNIREISTSISLQDGDVVILGGLIDRREVTDDSGVPGVSAIPLLGYLFKNENASNEIHELAVILEVNVL
jgi:MSHA type pilus biogenesis protein MshL